MKSTLSFIAGMLVGIILFVVAIGGAIFGLATATSIGKLQTTIGVDFIDSESEIYNKTIWDVVTSIIDDVQNVDTLTVQTLIDKYGLPIPTKISGVDISSVFKYPIMQIPDHVDEIVNSITLQEIGGLIGVDFTTYDIPVIKDNLNNNIQTAMDGILSILNESDTLTLRTIEDKFGITLGSNDMLDKVKDTPFPSIADVLTSLMLGQLITADTDTFLKTGTNTVYVDMGENPVFEAIPKAELQTHTANAGVESYYAGKSEQGDLLEYELRYIKKVIAAVEGEGETEVYVVDNSSHAANYNPDEEETVYYRCLLYKPYSSTESYTEDTVYAIPSYANAFKPFGTTYAPYMKGFLSLTHVFTAAQDGALLNTQVEGASINIGTNYWYTAPAQDGSTNIVYKPVEQYGYSSTNEVDGNTKLTTDYTGYIRVHEGTSEAVLQTVAYLTLQEIQDGDEWISSIKLNEVITIDNNSPLILRSLADSTLGTISDTIETLKLNDIIEIKADSYIEDNEGIYVYIAEKNCYVIYNAADSTHQDLQRYSKQVNADASPALLQRFAGSSLTTFSTDFGDLVLSDVLDIDPDIYTNVTFDYTQSNPTNTYYYYSDGLYKEASNQYIIDNQSVQYYMLSREGSSNAVLKKLAFIKIDNMAAKMEEVINDTYLSDLIDVCYNSVVKDRTSTTDDSEYFIIAPDEAYTVIDASGTHYFTYVYDSNGKYVKRPTLYLEINDTQLADVRTENTISFVYEQIYTLTGTENIPAGAAAIVAAELTQNVFYKKDNTYIRNPALTTYLATQGRFENLYKRTVSNEQTTDTVTDRVYRSDNLYLEVLGEYITYNPENPAHAGQPLFYKYTGGYYLASDTQKADSVNAWYFDYNLHNYVQTKNDTCGNTVYIKLSETKNPDGSSVIFHDEEVYYYTLVDNSLEDSETLYSRVRCESIYRESAEGTLVYFDGGYVSYNLENTAHSTLTRYNETIGYLATLNETALKAGAEDVCFLSTDRVSLVTEKSVAVLQAFARNKATVATLNDCIASLKISDLMEVAPGSIFDHELLRNATLSTMDSVFSQMLKTMTIGDLLEWGNINKIDENVKSILKDATLTSFFDSLIYQNGNIIVDIGTLLGA